MNNKTVIWIIAVIAVAAIAVGAFMFIGRDTTDAPAADTTAEGSQSTSGTSSSLSTLGALLTSGQAQQCTFSFVEGDSTGTGSIYLTSDERMRGNFMITTDGETQDSHIINDGSAQYFWQAGSDQGMKTTFTSEDLNDSDTTDAAADYGFDQDEEYDFSCSAWSVDETVFMPPADVNFMDMSSLLQ